MSIQKMVLSLVLLSGFGINNAYAQTCHAYEHVPASFKCDTPTGGAANRFDDFSMASCRHIPAHTVPKEIPCPTWQTPPNATYSAAATCGLHQQVPSSVDGQSCASGERRPSVGAGASGINYRYGTFGNNHDRFINDKGGDEIKLNNGNYYCYGQDKWARQAHDHDGTDLVVAYYCQ